MKDSTAVIVTLIITGIFALALFSPQFVVSQPSMIDSNYYENMGSETEENMGDMDMMKGGMMQGGMPMMKPTIPPQTSSNYSRQMMPMMSPEMRSPQAYGNYTFPRMGMMGGMPMMRGMMGYYSQIPTPISHDNAIKIAKEYLASADNPDLVIDEFEEYSHNFYISVIEMSTGRGAFELIIDRYYGNLQPEPQSMKWNSKYSMMGGHTSYGASEVEMTVTPEQALKMAQDFLDVAFPGTRVGEITSYYGYYTIMTTLEGEHYGMLSVNGYTGDVWYHTWHGMFISEIGE